MNKLTTTNGGVLMKKRKYHLDPGYITIPDANKIVLRILRIANQADQTHYRKILAGAKKGLYGGKKYGERIYTVLKKDIIQYAEELLQEEQKKLLHLTVAKDLKEIETHKNMPPINHVTAEKIRNSLTFLKFHTIISENVYRNGEQLLNMRLEISKFKAT